MIEQHCKIGKVTAKLSVVQPMPYPVNYDAVRYAERLLEDCKSGEYRSIAVCAINARGYCHTAYSLGQNENPVLMQGTISWLNDQMAEKVRKSP